MHYQSALDCRFIELVFETAQIIVNLTVLLLQLALKRNNEGPGLPTWKAAGSVVSAVFGLVSLTVAATVFIRVSPRSFWAGPSPTRLFLGIIDIGSTTWVTSLLTGMYCASGLFLSTFGFAFYLYDVYFLDKGGIMSDFSTAMGGRLHEGVLIIILYAFAYMFFMLVTYIFLSGCCCGCCEGIGSRAVVLQASMISVFVLVPWVAVPGEGSTTYTYAHTPHGLRTFWPVLSLFVVMECIEVWQAVEDVMQYVSSTRASTNSAYQAPDPLKLFGKSQSWAIVLLQPCLLVLEVISFSIMTAIRRKQRDQGQIKTALCQPTYKWCTRKLTLILQGDEAIGLGPQSSIAATTL